MWHLVVQVVDPKVAHWILVAERGKPWQNGTDESFNGKFRDECLSMEYFRKRLEARVVIEQWRCHYNEVQPHSAQGYLIPAQYIQNQPGNDRGAIRPR